MANTKFIELQNEVFKLFGQQKYDEVHLLIDLVFYSEPKDNLKLVMLGLPEISKS